MNYGADLKDWGLEYGPPSAAAPGQLRCVYCQRAYLPLPADYCCPERHNRVRVTLALQDRIKAGESGP